MKGSGFFSWGGLGGPPIWQKFCQSPPSDTCPRFWTKACPPPAEVRPRKFEKFKYIFVSNLTTFKLKSTFKSCISFCIKWAVLVLVGFFSQVPPHPTLSPSETDGDRKFWVPPIKNLEKKTLGITLLSQPNHKNYFSIVYEILDNTKWLYNMALVF